MKSINSEEFFKKVSLNSGGVDITTVKNVFYGIIKTISRELRERRTIRLPDWGDFNLKIYKERKMKEVNYGREIYVPAKPMVKFTPDYKVKKYFYSLGEDGTL